MQCITSSIHMHVNSSVKRSKFHKDEMLVNSLWAVLGLSNSVQTYFFTDSVDKLVPILGYLVARGGWQGSKDLGSIRLFLIISHLLLPRNFRSELKNMS